MTTVLFWVGLYLVTTVMAAPIIVWMDLEDLNEEVTVAILAALWPLTLVITLLVMSARFGAFLSSRFRAKHKLPPPIIVDSRTHRDLLLQQNKIPIGTLVLQVDTQEFAEWTGIGWKKR